MAINTKVFKMSFASVFPYYIKKIESKGGSLAELYEVLYWLTGYDESAIKQIIEDEIDFETFFSNATLHKNVHLIKGVICGYRVEEIQDPLYQKIRYMDKLIDELAKGKSLDKILRK